MTTTQVPTSACLKRFLRWEVCWSGDYSTPLSERTFETLAKAKRYVKHECFAQRVWITDRLSHEAKLVKNAQKKGGK